MRRHTGATPADARQLHGFYLNAVFRAGNWIVKLPQDVPSLDAEVFAIRSARGAGVSVPTVAASGAEPRPYLVLEVISGHPTWEGTDDVLRQAAAQLRLLHDVRLPGAGWLSSCRIADREVEEFGDRSWEQFLVRSVGVAEELARGGLLTSRDVEGFAGVLQRHGEALEPADGPRLCHGDVHPRHMFAADGRLTGIIDWQDAVAGDPLLDIGRLSRCESPAVVTTFLEGYEPDANLKARLPIAIPAYRMLWSAWTAYWEHRGGSDWVTHHIAAVRAGLWELA